MVRIDSQSSVKAASEDLWLLLAELEVVGESNPACLGREIPGSGLFELIRSALLLVRLASPVRGLVEPKKVNWTHLIND